MNDPASIGRLKDAQQFCNPSETRSVEKPAAWDLATFAGRLSELSGDPAASTLSLVMHLVLQAQKQAEPAAWITSRASTFYPPDASDRGIDLSALALIRVHDNMAAARAAEYLLRSGAFGLLVLDLGAEVRMPMPALSRLAGQARRNEAALVFLTEKPESQASISSLISLRAHTHGIQREGRHFRCSVRIIKDKRQGPGWSHVEVYRGPNGLC